jgi:4-hydroxy-tetrahydrodipicolinate synthase
MPIEALPGVYAAALTPLRADFEPDYERLAAHCKWLLSRGCDGVAPLGTTGEANSLSLESRLGAAAALKRAGLPAERVIVGTGSCAVRDAIAMTRSCLEAGYPNVLVLPPFYYKNPSEDGLFAYFAGIVEAAGSPDLRIYLYHFPQMSTVPITASLIGRLREAFGARIAGLKDSSGDWSYTETLIRSFPGFRVYSGTEQYLARNVAIGGAGCISATTNLTASLAAELLKADAAHRQALDAELAEVRLALQRFPFSAACKQVMAWHTGDASWRTVAPPLVKLSAAQADELKGALAGFRLFRETMPLERRAA